MYSPANIHSPVPVGVLSPTTDGWKGSGSSHSTNGAVLEQSKYKKRINNTVTYTVINTQNVG